MFHSKEISNLINSSQAYLIMKHFLKHIKIFQSTKVHKSQFSKCCLEVFLVT